MPAGAAMQSATPWTMFEATDGSLNCRVFFAHEATVRGSSGRAVSTGVAFEAATRALFITHRERRDFKMPNTRRICAGLLTAAALAAAPASWAMEPGNNFAPWSWVAYNGDATVYSPPTGGRTYNGYEAISSTTDVDHLIATCGTGKVQSIGIDFTHANGDLDITVYDLSGNVLGSSTGVSNTEVVNLNALSKQAVVMKVYGYNGAQNPYNISITCG